jgi:hypothetical protein
MIRVNTNPAIAILLAALALEAGPTARADVVTEWDATACDAVVSAKLNPAAATRVVAIVQTAAFEAANAVTRRYPASGLPVVAAPGASVEAAIAAATRITLAELVPSQQAMVDAAYDAALAKIADGPAEAAGVAAGERAAAAVLAMRAEDGFTSAEAYRPLTTPGVYVPTVIPVVPTWPQRKPWLMSIAGQLRPDPPPTLSSEVWARDYNPTRAARRASSVCEQAPRSGSRRFG